MARSESAGRRRVLALLILIASIRTSLALAYAQNTARGAPILVGCFSSSQPLIDQGTYKYQSSGYCSGICTSKNMGVVGLSAGNRCWCGKELPSVASEVLSARCDTPCQGYGIEDCGGGTYYFTVWLTGQQSNVPNYKPKNQTSTSSSSSTTKPSTSTSTTSTPGATETNPIASANASHQKGDKKLGIILGVVIGAIAFAIMALVFCCMMRRQRKTGSFFLRNSPSPLLLNTSTPGSEVSSILGDATIYVAAGSRKWEGRISCISVPGRRSSRPPLATQTSSMQIDDGNSRLSPDNASFHTTNEDVLPLALDHAMPGQQDSAPRADAELHRNDPTGQFTQREAAASVQDFADPVNDFPRTAPMEQRNVNSLHHPQDYVDLRQSPSSFINGDDDEAADAISPMAVPPVAMKRVERRSMPAMVHYPSWSEVSSFDFSGDGARLARKSAEGWHRLSERRDGRYELA